MKRVLLKLSGEALAGEKKTGFDEATVIEVAKQIREISKEGLEIGIVIGGGNFWRGRTSETIDRNRNACYSDELHLCVRYLQIPGNEDTDLYTVCLWCIYRSVFQRCSGGELCTG